MILHRKSRTKAACGLVVARQPLVEVTMRQHVLKLDALRGLAAQPVAISHSAALVFAPSAAMTFVGWCAHLSVVFFFVLSGYAIIGGLREEATRTGTIDLFDYGIRRVARIYPPYLLTVTAVTIYFLIFPEPAYNTDTGSILRSLPFAFIGGDAITLTPVWSLRIEVVLYAIAGLAAFALSSRSSLLRNVCFAAAAVLTALMLWRLSFGFTALVSFAIGGALYVAFGNRSFGKESDTWKFFAPLGSWSYTLYLIHMPVVLVAMKVTTSLDPITRVAIAVILANIVSAALAKIFERPKEFSAILRSTFRQIVTIS